MLKRMKYQLKVWMLESDSAKTKEDSFGAISIRVLLNSKSFLTWIWRTKTFGGGTPRQCHLSESWLRGGPVWGDFPVWGGEEVLRAAKVPPLLVPLHICNYGGIMKRDDLYLYLYLYLFQRQKHLRGDLTNIERHRGSHSSIDWSPASFLRHTWLGCC